LAISRLFGW